MTFNQSCLRKTSHAITLLFFLFSCNLNAQFTVYDGQLCSGCEIGVDSELKDRTWKKNMGNYEKLQYPGGQNWGAVFITFGLPQLQKNKRQSKDFSEYTTISIELKGEEGGEVVAIGLKDTEDPPNGSETKITQTLTTSWQTYTFDLTRFRTCDLTKLHLPVEFVFGRKAATIYFKNVVFR